MTPKNKAQVLTQASCASTFDGSSQACVMIVKSAEPQNKDLELLEKLLLRPSITVEQRKLIEQELRTMRSGIKGEKEAAYELNFHYGNSGNWAILHDIRLQHGNRVAQIDHLAINRLMEVWVCESKRFSEGVAINQHGEFSAFYSGKPCGMPSPIEQNRKHCDVLSDVFSNNGVPLPKRIGITIHPKMRSLILVSKNARIQRPKKPPDGIEQIIKVDQFRTFIGKDIESTNPLMLTRLIGTNTLMDFAYGLASLHRPIQFDWVSKFGLTPEGHDSVDGGAVKLPTAPNACQAEGCQKRVSAAIVKFCQDQRARFGGGVYCMGCQKRR